VVAVFVSKNYAIELLRPDAALFQTQSQLTGAESAINENVAVTGRNQRAITGAAASEHRQTEHAGCLIELINIHKRKRENDCEIFVRTRVPVDVAL
jgi:hypothetical protein